MKSTITKPRTWKTGRSRKERSELVYKNLIWSATKLVGEVGYAAASIAKITEQAGVAQGTFYNYFQSRQDILDKLLPNLGAKMLAYIREKSRGGKTFEELEELSFIAFFDFLDKEPHFFRILNEAESYAPAGYAEHLRMVANQYQKFLKRSYDKGDFPNYDEDELETVSFILMASRSYLAQRYANRNDNTHKIPSHVNKTYMKLILFGLQGAKTNKDQ